MRPIHFYRNLRIRYKLLFSYASGFILIIALVGFTTYSILHDTVEANIESELKNSTSALLNMVRTAVSVSIKNHLRAVAEKNLEMVQYFYTQYQKGIMSEAQARQAAAEILLSQKIGTTGYIAVVDSNGVLVVHPKEEWVGKNISKRKFVQKMISRKEGYIEYDWKNPGEAHPRPKALYVTYFKQWDWLINVSSYRREFSTLVNVNDFRESVLSLKFGKTGYSFVVDKAGNFIIHPLLQGMNIFKNKDIPQDPLNTMLKQKSGKLVYFWQNPGEDKPREKLVIFNYLPEYEWIVASSSYLDEFYSPLDTVSNALMFTVITALILILPITFLVSRSITNPLRELIHQLNKGAAGDLSVRVHRKSQDEIGQLALFFNLFMEKLETYNKHLEAEIADRKKIEEALRVSEEKYRSVMENAPDPIIVYDMDGRVTYLNPAFTNVFGWQLEECLGKRMENFVPDENWEETRQGLEIIAAGKPFSSIETRRFTKDGKLLDVSVRGSVYRDRNGKLLGSVIIHRDVTDLKRLEKEVMDIGDKERQKIGQDLHDDLCPHLIGIEGLATVLKRKIGNSHGEMAALCEMIVAHLKEAISKTRRMARGLCPVYLVDHGLASSLNELSRNTETVFGVTCEFKTTGPLVVKDNIAATHVFRIVQEAVHNAVKHGRADQITIESTTQNDRITIRVSDNGIGIPKELETDGMGLRIMRFRAKMINAALDIRSRENQGTSVHLSLENPGEIER